MTRISPMELYRNLDKNIGSAQRMNNESGVMPQAGAFVSMLASKPMVTSRKEEPIQEAC